jgi:hypothetical protein
MAEILPNQPVIFSEVLDCHLNENADYMLAQYGDITQFQMGLEPCGSDFNNIVDGTFPNDDNWTLESGWTISDGQACHAVGVYGTIYQLAPAADGVLMRLRFTLDISAGSSCLITYGSYIENFFSSGTYERWITADTATFFVIAANGSSAVCVSAVSMMTINTNFEVYIVDENGTTVDTLDINDGYFNLEDGYFTTSIDWETLAITEGCYTLQVFDPCPCSQGGIVALDFTTSIFNWSLAASWSIIGGTATYNGSSTGQAILNHVVCDGTEYEVSYKIENMTGNEEFNVRLGTQNGTTRTADGTYTDTITSDGTSFILIGNSTSGTQTFDVTIGSFEISTKTSTYTSNLIKLSETDFGCRTYNLAMCNDTDGLGFGFANTGFRPNFRADCSLLRGTYPMTRESYEYSNGRKSVTYGRSRVARELGIDTLPHLIDFLALSLFVDHFYIDEAEYFVEDDEMPSVSWDENQHYGGFSLNVSEKIQLLENRRLSSASVGCDPNGVKLLDNNGVQIVDETDSEIVTP